MNVCFKFLCRLALIFIWASAQADSSGKFDIYYISVGSGHYPKGQNKNREEAINSAQKMSYILKNELLGNGIELVSTIDHPVTNNELSTAIYDLKKKIRNEKPNNPLIIFYFMGHGLGTNQYDQYIMLGNFEFDKWANNKQEISYQATDNPNFFKSAVPVISLAQSFYQFSLDDSDSSLDEFYNFDDSSSINSIINSFRDEKTTIEGIDKNIISFAEGIGECQKKYYKDLSFNLYNCIAHQKKIHTSIPSEERKKALQETLGKMNISIDTNNISKNLEDTNNNYNNSGKPKSAETTHEVVDFSKINPVVKESKQLKQHVPYLILIDSCSNGVEGGFDHYLKKGREFTKVYVEKAYGVSYPNMEETNYRDLLKGHEEELKKVRQNHTSTFVKDNFGDIYGKYGGLFFSANPGHISVSTGINTFVEKKDKIGVLAIRFEQAIDKTKTHQKPISLGDLIEIFKDDLTTKDVNEPIVMPFSWFTISPDLLEQTLIE